MEDTMQQISDILSDIPSALLQSDPFAMTPLHILALAQTPRLELFQVLSSVDPALSARDQFGSTPLDYLEKNISEGGLQVTRWLVQQVVEQKGAFLGLDRWKQELFVMKEGIERADCSSTRNREIQSLLDRLAKLEFLEVLSLAELVLWKIKLGENTLDQESIDRESSRIHCGISILVGNVLPFLGKE
ncbi:unnamed protein product [Cylindrotheca closterium]|uniref:Uncharacterized protein n=1 Tax=Cylindrotheca closterium TaxID=2856 RepID=A0AAD2G0I8_9STRA|nr:unnamed protein product [Cylindrotheca closterium]